MTKQRLYWSLQVAGWSFYAIGIIISFLAFDENVGPKTRTAVFFEAFLLLWTSHCIRFVVIKRGWLQMPISKVIWYILGLIVLLTLPIYPAKVLYSNFIGLDTPGETFDFGLVLNYSFFLFLWTLIYFSYHYFVRYSQSLKYEATMREVELAHLKSQLNPHFIFNALNSIRALVDENPAKSKDAINQLSNILRTSFAGDKMKLTRFENEFETVKDYLALEATRFEERLNVAFDIHPESNNYLVPPLMLQTLVENGIKHGISNLKKGGTIRLSTFVEEGIMHIQIRNTGQLTRKKNSRGAGLGLKNTRKRLDLIFGDNASFNIFNENDHTVLAVVTIPIIKQYESINN